MSYIIQYKPGQVLGVCIFLNEEIRIINKDNISRRGRFRCICGNEFLARIQLVKSGITKSCGCYNTFKRHTCNVTHGGTIGGKATSEYAIWMAMKDRCTRKTCKSYHHYGGRGITVCKRWMKSFQNFIDDMGVRPTTKHSIERLNNNKGYSPKNCKWVTRTVQNRNLRRNVYLDYNGERLVLSEWADRMKIPRDVLRTRFRWGKRTLEQIFTTPFKDYPNAVLIPPKFPQSIVVDYIK